jgi:hypothetical protein
MRTHVVSRSCWAFLTLTSLLLGGTAVAAGQILEVRSYGVDSATCGSSAKPCRSIDQTIENAADGDSIEVGAGRYGDVSGAGTFSNPGDEHGQVFPDYSCMVCITKALKIFSLHGAAVTVIQGKAGSQFRSNVSILHDGVTFGAPGRGFTLTGGSSYGVSIDEDLPFNITHGITIAGNVDLADGDGFAFLGPEFQDRPPPTVFAGRITFANNEADSCGTGFHSRMGQNFGAPMLMQNNVARGCGTGFFAEPSPANESFISTTGSGNLTWLHNLAIHNTVGFNADAPGPVESNTAIDNSQFGFTLVPGGAVFRGNSAIDNGGPGVLIQFSTDLADEDPPFFGFTSFSQNNFFGNDRNRPDLSLFEANGAPFAPWNPGPSAHCGVLNVGALADPVSSDHLPGPPVSLPAAKNYWGSAAGPQTTGPGDAAGGVCDQNGGTTVTKPFATEVFDIAVLP